ncbi:MAG: hypothetical protein HZB33_07360, partial [Nitrospirae bacterium]|nr:hypothetical protein [Nitrospirota bacterium]
DHPSFNLAQAVLIIAYEISLTSFPVKPPQSVISNEVFLGLFERLKDVMKMAGYAPKGIRDEEGEIMTDLRRLISRAAITAREARMLHGIISQIEDGFRKKTNENSR